MADAPAQFFHLPPGGPATARLQEAEGYFLAGNLNEALAAAQQAWRAHPDQPDVFRVLAYVHMARGEYEPAAGAGYHAVQLDPENPSSYAVYAQVFVSFNVLAKADETLMHAVARFPNEPALLALAADVAFRRHRDADGESAARRALAVNPDDAYAKVLLGTYCLRRRWYAQAEPLLTAATVAYPHRFDYQRDAGIAALHAGHPRAAVALLRAAWQLNRQDVATQQHLFAALQMSGSAAVGYWRLALYFREHMVGGWFLVAGGLVFAFIALVILSILAATTGGNAVAGIWALCFLIAACALILPPIPGLALRARKGKKLKATLTRLLPPEPVV
jgi:Tfp pilus assembly protein PilF